MSELKLSHIGTDNRATMVDVSHKSQQLRTAMAKGFISLNKETIRQITENTMKKGNVLTTAEIAGIQAAKRTHELIPLCHVLNLSKVTVKVELMDDGAEVTAVARCIGNTGVEMEALTGVNVALLTIYDMCKAVDKHMVMGSIELIEKTKEDL